MIIPTICDECGSGNLRWFADVQNQGSAVDGRVRMHETKARFVLGCEACSETLLIVLGDEIATRLNQEDFPPGEKKTYELKGEASRRLAEAGLNLLWAAMELTAGGGGIHLPESNKANFETYYRLYRHVGEFLLGEACPEHEVLC